MRFLKYKHIEFSEIKFSELGQEMRFDADYWEPAFLRNEDIITAKKHVQTKRIAPNPQYGISISMNEDGQGYSILKMDNIMDVLAEDKDAKYADISDKTFEQFKLNKFDVLFNRVNSDEFVGRTGIYLLDGQHTFASYLVRVDSGKSFTNCYLTAYLNSKYGKTALRRIKRRAVNQANINAKELSNLNIPLPSDGLQKAIEKLILEAQSLKSSSEKQYQDAEAILLNELGLEKWLSRKKKFKFHGVPFEVDDTVNAVPYSQVFHVDRIDSEYWEAHYFEVFSAIKKYKETGLLKDVCVINETLTTPEKNSIHKYIELANIGADGIIEGYKETTGDKLPSRARRLVKINQVIVSSIEGSLESCAIIPKELDNAFCSTGFYLLDSDKVNSETLLILFKSKPFQALMKKACSGTILTAISRRFFKNLIVPVVDLHVQKKIKAKVIGLMSDKKRSKELIEMTKRSVEIFIEQDEKAALNFIKKSTKIG